MYFLETKDPWIMANGLKSNGAVLQMTNESEYVKPGKVYIASMNCRGNWAQKPPGAWPLNVTSAQPKKSQEGMDLSPMHPKGYRGFINFEAYWQAGKVWDTIPREQSVLWWKSQTAAKRRYPSGRVVLWAIFEDVSEKKLDYVSSRKLVYAPQYAAYIANTTSLKKWKDIVHSGQDVVVFDFDGVRKINGDVDIKIISLDLLKEKINDTRHPFGHGFIVAALLAGISVESFL